MDEATTDVDEVLVALAGDGRADPFDARVCTETIEAHEQRRLQRFARERLPARPIMSETAIKCHLGPRQCYFFL